MNTRIDGYIVDGCGRASQIDEQAYRTRCEATGLRLHRGTLNVRVRDLEAALASLGEPDFFCDGNNPRLGDIRWWKVTLECELPSISQHVYIMRHLHSGAPYLEIMSDVRLRDLGIQTNTRVTLARR